MPRETTERCDQCSRRPAPISRRVTIGGYDPLLGAKFSLNCVRVFCSDACADRFRAEAAAQP